CSSRRRHTILVSDWSSDVCSSDLKLFEPDPDHICSLPVSDQFYVHVATASQGAWRERIDLIQPDNPGAAEAYCTGEASPPSLTRSEERRVGKEDRSRGCTEE